MKRLEATATAKADKFMMCIDFFMYAMCVFVFFCMCMPGFVLLDLGLKIP